jgi:hypothetical protein
MASYHLHQVVTSGLTPSTATNLWVVTQDWTNGAGGYGSEAANGETYDEDFWPPVAWPQSQSPGLVEWVWTPDDDFNYYWDITTNSSELSPVNMGEHCDVNWNYPLLEFGWQQRTADAEYKLATGGPPGSKQQNLWVISATAWAHTNSTDGYGTPVPPQQIQIGSLGNLDTNGNLFVVLPDNDPDNVTLKVNGDDNYTFTVSATEYTLRVAANTQWLSDGLTPNPQFCVGQQITFSPSWTPSAPPYVDAAVQWTLPGTFVNTNSDPNCDLFYSEDASQLNRIATSPSGSLSTSCWYVDKLQSGNATLAMNLTLTNGQHISLSASGTFDVHRPTTAQASPYQPDGNPTAIIANNPDWNLFSLYSPLALSLGVTGVTNDMSFQHTITTDSFSAGQAGYVQVITSGDIETSPGLTQPSGIALDAALGEFPRGQPAIPANTTTNVWFCDAPLVPLPKSSAYVTEDTSFSTYLMFKPSGGIWVPLRLIQWELHDEADPNSAGGWSAYTYSDQTGTRQDTKIKGDTNSVVFPDWTTHYP